MDQSQEEIQLTDVDIVVPEPQPEPIATDLVESTPSPRSKLSSPEREMRFDASPFVPIQTNFQLTPIDPKLSSPEAEQLKDSAKKDESLSPLSSQKLLIQERLEKQIKVMKAQH